MSTLPMTPHHQELVERGKKTTTLRSQKFAAGHWVMHGGDPELPKRTWCEVVKIEPRQIWWTSLTPEQKLLLAQSEGYDTALGLQRELARLGHKYFLQGKRGLWLHHLRPVTDAQAIELQAELGHAPADVGRLFDMPEMDRMAGTEAGPTRVEVAA